MWNNSKQILNQLIIWSKIKLYLQMTIQCSIMKGCISAWISAVASSATATQTIIKQKIIMHSIVHNLFTALFFNTFCVIFDRHVSWPHCVSHFVKDGFVAIASTHSIFIDTQYPYTSSQKNISEKCIIERVRPNSFLYDQKNLSSRPIRL